MKSKLNDKARPVTAAALIIVLMMLTVTCNRKDEHAAHDEYTCPMHPTVVQDHPGSCPVCGMELVRKGQPGEEVKITAELNYLLKPTNAIVTSSIKTVQPQQRTMDAAVTANGIVTYDTRRLTAIPVRTAGRIERLFIKYNFQPVRQGQKILEIYSPELETARRELDYLLESDKDNATVIEAAKEKLRLLGVGDAQISTVQKQTVNTVAVYSPVDGYIVEERAANTQTGQAKQQAASGGGMDAMSSQNAARTSAGLVSNNDRELSTREGMYVSAGQSVFRVFNSDVVWAEFDLYQTDGSLIKINTPLEFTSPEFAEPVKARVDFVQPFFRDGQSFAKVRVYLTNTDKRYHIGQLLSAKFQVSGKDGMWIPATAKLDLGTRTIAFVKRRGVFRPTAITTTERAGDWIAVASGLQATDSIATNAQFLVDSESFIKVRN